MFRTVIAVGLALALQGGALYAPFVHAHLDEHDHDHTGKQVVHAHFNGHHVERPTGLAGTPALGSDDEPDRVTYLQVFLAVHSESPIAPGIPPGRFAVPTVHEVVLRQAPEMVRSHGPPEGRPAEPRAPPAFLS